MITDGDKALKQAELALGVALAEFVAATSRWAAPEVWNEVRKLHPHGAWFPNQRRFRRGAGERKGQYLDGLRLDDNTAANGAAKLAILGHKDVQSYAVCHVWPSTCYDERYHTSIANLILVPSAIAGLTDHDPLTTQAIRFRAYELYGWHPEEVEVPTRPHGYPTIWLEPASNSDVQKRLKRWIAKQVTPSAP